jgi:hypothetical protein
MPDRAYVLDGHLEHMTLGKTERIAAIAMS